LLSNAATGLCLAATVGLAAIVVFARSDTIHVGFERLVRKAEWRRQGPWDQRHDPARLEKELSAHGLSLGAPVFIRIFKRDFELELWMKRDGRFHLFKTYPICNWSGSLGPKLKEGDRQAPEGFYTVDATALNPSSRWHRSFNLGFPNPLDRQHNRTGSYLMVHGGCSSIGCYAMTNPIIDEIWSLITQALAHGQKRFHVHIFPFRLTAENLDRRKSSPWHEFWQQARSAQEAFETTWLPPKVFNCNGSYAFEAVDDSNSHADAPIETGCPHDQTVLTR
jgi:murein L,D-transpeptidase YafK